MLPSLTVCWHLRLLQLLKHPLENFEFVLEEFLGHGGSLGCDLWAMLLG